MKLGEKITSFIKPPHPKGLSLLGDYVRLEPLDSDKHGKQFFEAFMEPGGAGNWDYLPKAQLTLSKSIMNGYTLFNQNLTRAFLQS